VSILALCTVVPKFLLLVMMAGSEVSTYLPFAGKDKIAKFPLFRLQADKSSGYSLRKRKKILQISPKIVQLRQNNARGNLRLPLVAKVICL
jgi:hypothetical protein